MIIYWNKVSLYFFYLFRRDVQPLFIHINVNINQKIAYKFSYLVQLPISRTFDSKNSMCNADSFRKARFPAIFTRLTVDYSIFAVADLPRIPV